MRILHVVARSQRRGAELVAIELARQLDARGHADRVVALNPAFDGTTLDAVAVLDRHARAGPLALVRSARALRGELARGPVDVVIAHGGRAAEAAVLARRRGTPRIVWQRILGFPSAMSNPIRRSWWRWVASRVDAAVALTPDLAEELRSLGFGGAVRTIPNFRDAEPFQYADRVELRRRIRTELGLPPETPLVLFVGHLDAQKRPDRAVDVLAQVRAAGPDAHLALAGDGPQRDEVAAYASSLGVDAYVHVLGSRADVPALLGAADVFLLTSDSEGVPGVLIEALMAGSAVVTVGVGGVRTVVEHGVTALVSDTPEPSELSALVVALLRDPERRRALGRAALRVSDAYGASRAAASYEELLVEVVRAASERRT